MLVLGPLSRQPEPFTYDLCHDHADKLTAPQGWQVVRLYTRYDDISLSSSDPEALLNAMKQPYEGGTEHLDMDESQQRHPSGKGADDNTRQSQDASATTQLEHSAQVIELPLRAQRAKEAQPTVASPTPETPQQDVEYGPFAAPASQITEDSEPTI